MINLSYQIDDRLMLLRPLINYADTYKYDYHLKQQDCVWYVREAF